MKRLFFVFFGMFLGVSLLMGCAPRDWFLVNSSGIATYNRHTGQFELLWEQSVPDPIIVRDTVYIRDSVNVE